MAVVRCILSGATPSPGEIWSVGLSYTVAGALIPAGDHIEAATNLGVAIAASSGNQLFQLLSSAGNINKIRMEQRSSVTDELTTAGEYTLPIPETGANTPTSTLQTSMCISLLTGFAGRSFRGRVYWPAWAYTPTSALLFGTSQQTNALTGFELLDNMVRAAWSAVDASYQAELVVRSRMLHQSTTVTQYAAGNIPDTQRRRRDALKETYVSLAT